LGALKVASLSRNRTVSVISSSSRLGARPESDSADNTEFVRLRFLNCTADKFTATRVWLGQDEPLCTPVIGEERNSDAGPNDDPVPLDLVRRPDFFDQPGCKLRISSPIGPNCLWHFMAARKRSITNNERFALSTGKTLLKSQKYSVKL